MSFRLSSLDETKGGVVVTRDSGENILNVHRDSSERQKPKDKNVHVVNKAAMMLWREPSMTVTDTWCMSTSTLLSHPFLSWSLQGDLKVLHGSRKKRAVNHHGHRNTCNHIYRISPEPVTIPRQTWTPSSPPSQPSRQIQHGPISGCRAIVRFGCQATRRVTARTRQP